MRVQHLGVISLVLVCAACSSEVLVGTGDDAGADVAATGGKGGTGGSVFGGAGGSAGKATGGSGGKAVGGSGGTAVGGSGGTATGGAGGTANGGSGGVATGGSGGVATGGSGGVATGGSGGIATGGSGGIATGGSGGVATGGSGGVATGGSGGTATGGSGGTGGTCVPSCGACTEISDAAGGLAHGIAVDANAVYYGSDVNKQYTIHRIAKNGWAESTLATGTGAIFHIAQAADQVFYTTLSDGSSYGSVRKVPANGGAETILTVGTMYNLIQAFAITADDTRVYWSTDVELSSIAHTGGSVDFTILPFTSQPAFLEVANNATHVFISDFGEARVLSFNKATKAVTTLATGQTGALALAVDSTHVYWALQDLAQIARTPLGGGSIELLGVGNGTIHKIATDGVNVYFNDGGAIHKVPVGGGTVSAVVDNPTCAADIVVDDTYVYFTTGYAGKVFRIAK